MILAALLLLLLSHLLTDFYLQPNQWVRGKIQKKHRAWQLYAHALIAGLLAFLFLLVIGKQEFWVIPAVVVPHFFIDLWKLNQKNRSIYFVIDQIFHGLHMVIVFFILFWRQINQLQVGYFGEIVIDIGIILFGILLLWNPVGILIGKLIKPYHDELEEVDREKPLPRAGKTIGILERLFIFILILIGQFAAIGFLIAAKSILRFSDHKEVDNPIRMSEYVIIGTLMSFLAAMLIGILCKFLLEIDFLPEQV